MMAWLPIFFMYFNDHLSMKHVIYLESLYYISVVILEVPSGMFSDRFGRKLTLILSSVFFVISYAIFGLTQPELINFAMAQVMLAGGISFMSGTNTAFHYESLQDLGLTDTFGDREARIQSYMQYGAAAAVLLGGFLGAQALHLPYVLSLAFMIPALIICLMFSEPTTEEPRFNKTVWTQVQESVGYLKIKELKWIFGFTVISYILAHIPYEFYQPYLTLLEEKNLSFGLDAAIYSGILFALTRILGAMAAGQSMHWTRKFGLDKICAAALIIQLIVIGSLGLILHPIIIVILLMRSFSMSMTAAPLNAEIAPRVKKAHRASYFSFQSLFSRLAFSISLVLLTIPISSEVINNWPTLSKILITALIAGTMLSATLWLVNSGTLFNKSKQSTN